MNILKHFLHMIKYFAFKFKVPKLNRSSFSLCTSQVKRHKQLQRLDLAKRQQHLQAQRERRQLAALTTTVSLEQTGSSDKERRQQRDAEAHQLARLDPHRRLEEQTRDRAFRQQGVK